MSLSALPLLSPRDMAAALAWRGGKPVSAAVFMAQARALAARLPASGQPVNLCADRYFFALGLVAAWLRGQTSLLPPNALPDTLARLAAGSTPAYGLSDDPALQVAGLHVIFVGEADTDTAQADPGPTDVPQVQRDLPAACLLTSGSTGDPQPHTKTWGALVANIQAEASRLADCLGRPSLAGLTLVATVPAQHSYGLESSVLLALLGGAAFDGGRPFYPADIAEALARVPRPRALVTTPFHLKTLLLAGLSLPPVDLVLCATAPLSPQLAAQAERALGGVLIEIYGCTEAGQVATRRTTAGEVWQTMGELRVARHGDGDTESFSVQGGHVGAPTPLADILEIEDPERFRLLGRANDLIHVAGKRTSLAHLNFHLNRIEGVRDGSFWLPDDVPEAVVRPVVFVVAPALSARQIVRALRQHLEPAFVPRRVVHVSALPRAATGKLTVQALRRFAQAHLDAAAGETLS